MCNNILDIKISHKPLILNISEFNFANAILYDRSFYIHPVQVIFVKMCIIRFVNVNVI